MTPIKTLLAAGLAATALGACGSDDEDGPQGLSKADYIARANAICKERNARLERAFEELFAEVGERGPTGEQAQAFVKQNLPAFRDATERRNRLAAPDGDEPEIEAIVAASEEGIAAIELGLTDPEAAKASITGNPLAKADKLSAAYGMKQCDGR